MPRGRSCASGPDRLALPGTDDRVGSPLSRRGDPGVAQSVRRVGPRDPHFLLRVGGRRPLDRPLRAPRAGHGRRAPLSRQPIASVRREPPGS